MNPSSTKSGSGISAHAAERYWRATLARDASADGEFFLGVRSTRIYCRPSCPARRPLRRNAVFFRTGQEAERQGFRACLRCKPNEESWARSLVDRAVRQLLQPGEEGFRVEELARKLATTPPRLRRAFQRVTGLAPRDLRDALRLKQFKYALREGKNITEALYETGYGSSSRIYERSDAQLGMTPSAYQKGGKGMKLNYTIAKSKLGKVLVAATDRGVSAVYLGGAENALLAELREEYPQAEISAAAKTYQGWVREIVEQIDGRSAGRELPLDVQGTAFQRLVWRELQRIPRGTTRTYTEIAKSLGRPKAVRAVASACARNPVSVVVPCHRVIRGDGNLAGYRWGIARKQQLLASERGSTK